MPMPITAAPGQLRGAAGAALRVLADGKVTPYDSGVRHIATVAGYLAYGLMALTVCFGVLTTTGWARRSVKRPTLYGGHMMLAVITLTFSVLHALAYVFQTGTKFSYMNAVVPLLGGGKLDVAPGVLGLELAVAVAVSIWAQRRLGYRRWHLVHYLAYPAFGLSLLHVVLASGEVQALGTIGMGVFGIAGAVALMLLLRMLPATRAVGARIAPAEL